MKSETTSWTILQFQLLSHVSYLIVTQLVWIFLFFVLVLSHIPCLTCKTLSMYQTSLWKPREWTKLRLFSHAAIEGLKRQVPHPRLNNTTKKKKIQLESPLGGGIVPRVQCSAKGVNSTAIINLPLAALEPSKCFRKTKIARFAINVIAPTAPRPTGERERPHEHGNDSRKSCDARKNAFRTT